MEFEHKLFLQALMTLDIIKEGDLLKLYCKVLIQKACYESDQINKEAILLENENSSDLSDRDEKTSNKNKNKNKNNHKPNERSFVRDIKYVPPKEKILDSMNQLIEIINTHIMDLFFLIKTTRCPETGERYFGIINTKRDTNTLSDKIQTLLQQETSLERTKSSLKNKGILKVEQLNEDSKRSYSYSIQEAMFFQKVIDEIVQSEEGEIFENQALNLAQKMTKLQANKFFYHLVKEKWLQFSTQNIQGENVRFLIIGIRSYLDLEMYLDRFAKRCAVCEQICVKGKKCSNCGYPIHPYCSKKLWQDLPSNLTKNCPNCRVKFD
ncbi:non-structural maintenance of chromosomes element 1 [Anaeramoeba flamelloides]|uniref:Non-structural maintenance of chromosomes element 1 homolog n=1 Tax=Anaeramoeba flamelloides TaxID=1746091 RepID=A0ABQ8YVM1_9EUKA|nr:non-structural maintenance of chromosomes element 1 [Anaeramoeba flamelloides]